jgi:oligosaccharide reducing-end xylanase
MKTWLKKSCLGATFVLSILTTRSQTIVKPYEVGTWEDFRQSAVTWTFDDGCSNQFAKVIPLFDKLGFKGTFFTVTSWSPQWTTLKKIASNGHEVASHTVTHANFSTELLQNPEL